MDAQNSYVENWEQIRKGDKEALLELYNDLYFHLLRYGLTIKADSDLIKDCISQLFLKLWDKHERLKSVENVKSYLFSCLRNLVYDHLQVENRASASLLNAQQESTAVPSYEEILIEVEKEQEFKKKLQVALKQLSPKQIELIHLKFFENRSYQEIASLNAQTVKTAYNTIYDAIKSLRINLKM